MSSRKGFAPHAVAAILFALGLELPAAVPGRAQAQPAADPAANQSRMTIDVEVTDKAGQPVSGLTAADFTLLDNKQPAKVLDFAAVEAHGKTAGVTQQLIVLDAINTSFITVAREREQLDEFLRQNGGELAHPTSIGILTEHGIKIDRNPTQDGNALLAVLKNYNLAFRQEGRSAGFYGAGDRLEWSLEQLSQLAAYESGQPGHKLLFFLSPGWPMLTNAGIQEDNKQRTFVFNTIIRLSSQLNQARVALYCLSPFGMGRTNPFYYQNYLKPVTRLTQAEYPALSLQVFAEHTGGRVFTIGNDIREEINTASRDAAAFYTLAFTAAAPGEKTEYHALQVKVDRPGVIVRTTAGYYVKADR